MKTYKVTASFERDGRTLNASQWEVLGPAFGERYLHREQAEAEAENLQDSLEDTDLDPSTHYEVTEAEVVTLGSVEEEWFAEDADGNDLPPDDLQAYVLLDVLIDGRVRYSINAVVGAHESDHGSVRASGAGVEPFLDAWIIVDSDLANVPRALRDTVVAELVEQRRRLWREVQELRAKR